MAAQSTRNSQSRAAASVLLCLLVVLVATAAPVAARSLSSTPAVTGIANAASIAGPRQLLQDGDNSKSKQQQCVDAFNAAGGTNGIAGRVPACSRENFKLQDCCSQTKSALSAGPDKCLCDAAVWSEVERQMTSSGITSSQLIAFTRACGIPNAGAGTC